jgi:hypothetical protein
MADDTDVLLKIFEEERNQAIHTETQRSTIAYILVLIDSAVILFIFQAGLKPSSLPLAMFLIIIGIFGSIISAKLYERADLHMEISNQIQRKLEFLYPRIQLKECVLTARDKNRQRHPFIRRIPLYFLWIGFHLLIALIGAIFTSIILLSTMR